ncbi:MAG: MFS transporter [Actinomycetota bacterium]|nr:MFS transporter [Actinomycetota bacterium]
MDAFRDARVLRSTALRALLIAESISTTGSQMTWLALPWFVLITTGSPARMSFVVAAELAGYVLVGIPAGSAITRFGARRTMLLCDALRGPLMLSIPLLHAAGLLSFWLLVLIAAAEGAMGAPYGAAQRVAIPELLGESEAAVGRANALFQGANRITTLAGPPLAGVLISIIGATNVLVIDALTYAVAFGLVLVFVPRRPATAVTVEDSEDARGLWRGIRYIASDPILRLWAIGLVVVDGCFQVVFLGLPVLVVAHYGRDPRLAGFLFGAWGAGAVLGNFFSYRYFSVKVRWSVVAPLVFAQALPLWLLAVPVGAPLLIGALALSGALNGLSNPTFHALITLRPPPNVRPKVLTAMFTASGLGGPLALLAAGPAFAAIGVRTVLAIAALGLSASLALEASAFMLTGNPVDMPSAPRESAV